MQAFLDAALNTAVMRYTYNYLRSIDRLPGVDSYREFKDFLYVLWFKLYGRECRSDSSGFEHVFIGEVRRGKVLGMHNWIQLLVEERKGNLDYLGFIPSRGVDGHEVPGAEHMMTISFRWRHCDEDRDGDGRDDEAPAIKEIGSSFFGTSPEFEMALYTLCLLGGESRNYCKLADRYRVDIVCHRIYGDKTGTCYPHVHGLDDDDDFDD